jgi:hypothetical protein
MTDAATQTLDTNPIFHALELMGRELNYELPPVTAYAVRRATKGIAVERPELNFDREVRRHAKALDAPADEALVQFVTEAVDAERSPMKAFVEVAVRHRCAPLCKALARLQPESVYLWGIAATETMAPEDFVGLFRRLDDPAYASTLESLRSYPSLIGCHGDAPAPGEPGEFVYDADEGGLEAEEWNAAGYGFLDAI